jgi:TetR/AcrR family transcriptional repressor of nem operon
MRPKGFDPQQALNAAMLQFWEAGYEGSSMQDLVDRMGISRQSLYDTYGNKRDLFQQSLRRYDRDVIQPKIALLSQPDVDPYEAVRAHLETIAIGAQGMPLGCLLVRAATEFSPDDAELAQQLDEVVRSMHQALTRLIERGQQLGQFDRRRAAADLAGSVIAASMGLHLMGRLPNRGLDLRPTIDGLVAGLQA